MLCDHLSYSDEEGAVRSGQELHRGSLTPESKPLSGDRSTDSVHSCLRTYGELSDGGCSRCSRRVGPVG